MDSCTARPSYLPLGALAMAASFEASKTWKRWKLGIRALATVFVSACIIMFIVFGAEGLVRKGYYSYYTEHNWDPISLPIVSSH